MNSITAFALAIGNIQPYWKKTIDDFGTEKQFADGACEIKMKIIHSVLVLLRNLPLRLRFTDCPIAPIRGWYFFKHKALLQFRSGSHWITHTDWEHQKSECRFCKFQLREIIGDHPVLHFMCCENLKKEREEAFEKNDLYRNTIQHVWRNVCMRIIFDDNYREEFLKYFDLAKKKWKTLNKPEEEKKDQKLVVESSDEDDDEEEEEEQQ